MKSTKSIFDRTILFVILTLFVITTPNLYSQVALKDVYGNILPQTLPPADSAYEPNFLIIWFNRNSINHQFLCDYWYYYHNPPLPVIGDDEKKDHLMIDPMQESTGCFELAHSLFTDSTIYEALEELGVTMLCQVLLRHQAGTLQMTHYLENKVV